VEMLTLKHLMKKKINYQLPLNQLVSGIILVKKKILKNMLQQLKDVLLYSILAK